MTLTDKLPKYFVLATMTAALGIVAYRYIGPQPEAVTVEVLVPELSEAAVQGKSAFDANCAQCHGENAAGTDRGPPLVHDIYNPGHHSDAAFLLAARRGVVQHHWPYGNMPAQPQVTEEQISAIVVYVRELQDANGITFKPHTM